MCPPSISNQQTEEGSKVKVKLKSPDFTSVTQNSHLTNKPEAYGVFILLPSLYQCSVLQVFKATLRYTERKKVERRICGHTRELILGPPAQKAVH